MKLIKLIVSIGICSLTFTCNVQATEKQPNNNVQLQNAEKVKTKPIITQKKTVQTKAIPPFKSKPYNGPVINENVLVVLMDFSNAPHGKLTQKDTENYIKSYDRKYYQDLFFGKNVTGPGGYKYQSLKSYYNSASSSSLSLTGQVAGWYRAKHPIQYYGANNDARASELVMEAAAKVAKDKRIDMKRYDRFDYYDLDKDKKVNEPDGIIDKFIVVYSGVGESEGGGKFGQNTIWEHVSEVPFTKDNKPSTIPGTYSKTSKFLKKRLAIAEYGMISEDSTVGTVAHEFGHMLGLPDEYDTASSSVSHAGEPVRYWSLMSYGKDAGKIPGLNPVSMSPYAKMLIQRIYGGNWIRINEVDYKQINAKKKYYLLDQSAYKGQNNNVIKVNLPPLQKKVKGKLKSYKRYYLIEWRNHTGLDIGLSRIKDSFGINKYGKGMLVWYVNEYYKDNSNLSKHFGESLIGVVDASPGNIRTSGGYMPMTDIQIFDAPFNTRSFGQYNSNKNYFFKKKSTAPVLLFDDRNYSKKAMLNMQAPDSSRVLPQLGIKIKVEDQNKEGTVGKISIYK